MTPVWLEYWKSKIKERNGWPDAEEAELSRSRGLFERAEMAGSTGAIRLRPSDWRAVPFREASSAGDEKVAAPEAFQMPDNVGLLERLIIRFPDIAERARQEYAPQHIANYLINLAGAFNAFYGTSVIVDAKEPLSPYRIELTKAFLKNMTDGLWLLGIKVPRRM